MPIEPLKILNIFIDQDKEAIEKLFSNENFDMNKADQFGFTLLHNAVLYCEVGVLKIILDQPQVEINAKTFHLGNTPFLVAAMNGKFEALKYLYERGADPCIINKAEDNALILAALSGSVDCLEYLLELELYDVNSVNINGANALMEGAKYPEIFKRLFHICDLNREDVKRAGLLHYACSGGSIEVVEMILKETVLDLHNKDNSGKTPIHYAIEAKNFDLVEFLIDNDASMTEFSLERACGYQYVVIHDDNETFLDQYEIPDDIVILAVIQAGHFNRTKTLKTFLERFQAMETDKIANIKENCSKALHIAAFSGNLECIKVLLESNFIDEGSYHDALLSSLRGNRYDCFQYIYEKLPEGLTINKDPLLIISVISGCMEACKLFLEQGIDPNTSSGLSKLMIASSNGNFELVEMLIKYGADVNYVCELGTALMWATEQGNLNIVKYLLEHGADPKLTDDHGFTPLIHANICGPSEVFDALYAKDQNLHYKSKYGNTLFLAACSRRNGIFVKQLIEKGANVNEVNKHGDNCFHRAAQFPDSMGILSYLLNNLENLDDLIKAKNKAGKTPLDLILKQSEMYRTSILESNPKLYKYLIGPKLFVIENNCTDICSICRDDFLIGEEAAKLPCNHLYHLNCFLEWSKVSDNCPYCKSTSFAIKRDDPVPSVNIPTETIRSETSSTRIGTSCCLIS